MDTRIAKQRRTARKRVIEAIEKHWCIGGEWSRDEWVDWLKDQGLISPRTNACDCRTVTATIARLKKDTLHATVFGYPPEKKLAALRADKPKTAKVVAFDGQERTVTLRFDLMPRVSIGELWLVRPNSPSSDPAPK